MKKIIPPVDIRLLEQELTEDKFLRATNVGNNYIYIVTAHDSPNVMQEIGRLREITFREAGGGTGKEVDIDKYDTAKVPFNQLIVWNNDTKEIISAYRFILGRDVPLDKNGYPHTPTSKLFHFSQKYIENQWQDSIELGRSFVQPKYQGTTNPRVGLFSLDNLWDGIGALAVVYPEAKYYLGKMTLYDSYNRLARNLILFFLRKYFKGEKNLITPIHPAEIDKRKNVFCSIFRNSTYKEDFKALNDNIRDLKTSIPPLIKSYMALSKTMQSFGASANPEFGPVEEIAILIKIDDIEEDKKKRYIYSFKKKKQKPKKNPFLILKRWTSNPDGINYLTKIRTMIKTISFLQSEVDWRKAPPPSLPEYAFIGRSNVGKSSLINMLSNHKSIAKISSKPGKTQTINHYLVNNAWYLVDLPGYGYAKTSKTMRVKWAKMIHDYLVLRENLQVVFVLVDTRLEPQKIDLEFINSLGEKQIPFAIIFTKSDKISTTKGSQNVEAFKNALLETWAELPPIFVSSAVTGKGRTEIYNYISTINSEAQ